jgi:prepilin-type N-terminal cleavage/methylation domain-containing protein
MAHTLNRPTGATSRRAAFTLIELLVVVSIIALLIGILLPTLGEARRQAGIVSCVATIRGNAQGVASYTADNQDRLPTAPPGNGASTPPTSGPPGQPAIAFANATDGYLNGWRFNPAERGSSGILYTTPRNTSAQTRVGIEAFWFIAFGNYMTETRGDAMLQEPFVSPTDRTTKAYWNTYRTLQLTDRNANEDGHYLRVPTYWYVLPALYHKSLFTRFGPLDTASQGGNNQNVLPTSKWRVFNRANSIQFTSNKAAFYQFITTHDRGVRTLWNDLRVNDGKGASISIAMFDGSAKNVKVGDENAVFQPPEPNDTVTDAGPTADGLTSEFQNDFNGNGPTYFKFTFGGLSGRDVP